MITVRASDLPAGSIIANDHTAWIKTTDDSLGHWLGTGDELGTQDLEIQERLDAGAVVVRYGTKTIHERIAASSLGTPEAVALRERTPVEVAQAIVERSKKIAEEARMVTRQEFGAAVAKLLTDQQRAQIRELHDHVEEAWLDGCAARHESAACCVDEITESRA